MSRDAGLSFHDLCQLPERARPKATRKRRKPPSYHLTSTAHIAFVEECTQKAKKKATKIPLNNEAVGLPKEKNKSDNKKSKKSGKKKSEKEKERKEQPSIRERKRRNKSEPIGSLTKPEKRRRMRASVNQRKRNSALSGPDQSEPCGHCKWIYGSDDDPKKDLPQRRQSVTDIGGAQSLPPFTPPSLPAPLLPFFSLPPLPSLLFPSLLNGGPGVQPPGKFLKLQMHVGEF
jgi:hypothetical protein